MVTMKAFFKRSLSLGYGKVDFLGSCMVAGTAIYFLRSEQRDMALIAARRVADKKAFRQGKVLSFEYRMHPGGEPDATQTAQLERFATSLVKREETIAATLDQADGSELPTIISSSSAGDHTRFNLELLPGGPQVELLVGERGRFDLDLFFWSVSVGEGCEQLAQDQLGRIQHFILWLTAGYMLGETLPGTKSGTKELTSKAVFVYFDLKRPYINKVTLEEIQVQRGDNLVVTIEVPSPCDNRCIFCAPAELLADEELLPRTTVMAEANRVLEELAPLIADASRVDVSLAGRDALNSDSILPLLDLLRSERKIDRITVVSPGTKLVDREFVARLRDRSLDCVNFTILGPDAAVHDAVTGRNGAFDDLVKSVQNLKEAGILFEFNSVVVTQNIEHLGGTVETAGRLGSGVRLYAYVSEPFVPLSRAEGCAPRYTEIAQALESNRAVCEDGLVSIHYVPLCLLPEWARPLAGHSSQSFPDAPEEPPEPCTRCPAYPERCGSIGTHYIELFGIEELTPLSE